MLLRKINCELSILFVMLELSKLPYRQIVGMIACVEKFLADAEERGNTFFLEVLEKQHSRMKGLYERRVVRVSNLMRSIPLTLSTIERTNQICRGYKTDKQEAQRSYSVYQILPDLCRPCGDTAHWCQHTRNTTSRGRLV